jgi:hypothetical protein
MIDKWASVGHKLGECFYDQDKGITYIHIPKNATTFIKACLKSLDSWKYSDSLISNDRYLVVLRDPIDRWITGMAQFEANNTELADPKENLDLTEDWIFDQITFDDHTEEQLYFLNGIDLNKCEFLIADHTLNRDLSKWFDRNGYDVDIDNIPKYNASDGRRAKLKDKYQQLVDKNPKYMLKLKQHFANDCEIVDSVRYHGT